jgi:hypothetical protein
MEPFTSGLMGIVQMLMSLLEFLVMVDTKSLILQNLLLVEILKLLELFLPRDTP